jgi:lipopolysaccharide/colanic/teichoic acid biosynthesis glycosyltransferase
LNDTWYRSRGKRLVDVVAASCGLLIAALPMLVIALLVRWQMGRPVIFRQTRPGLHGRPFDVVKFRTMSDQRDSSGCLLPDYIRLTPLGRWLRRTSLDELPQLWNVLRGEMSFVGPRPLRMDYLPYYTTAEQRRHDVLPGLTGLAQINGRNTADWDQRLLADVEYVERLSLALDLRILLATIVSVLTHEGVAVNSRSVLRPFSEVRGERSGGAVGTEPRA